MAKILVAGLNPAWQQVFRLPGFRSGAVNRADAFWSLGSGKGLNVARILARHGHEVHLLQVLAGENGRRVRAACEAAGVRSLEVWAEGETRVCATLLREGAVDEIIAPFRVDEDSVAERLLELSEGASGGSSGYDAMLACGTAPAGLRPDLLADLALRAVAPLLVWDSMAALTPEILPRITWLKVNAEELAALEPSLAASSKRPDLFVTDGARAARLRTGDGSWACVPPRVAAMVNPIGAGDAATAVFTDGILWWPPQRRSRRLRPVV